ncbi:hypothetical protein A3E39_01850 [Candidatus Uhrbacteria bacterium RIFCSPHIGHO2_12_FULL_60_25]|uniref:Uncharacterized protein n=1 Tax=Candidatus Uhrbacteria bacterium RIFCSPHIGHO2_12_FULL_60_25 TaxID=1802399 RepID=A0A1F7UN85_9BACT|nr:MAG: hypothetical protein A3D73_02525 [Candidatus Uhrbacteria bacterium RIFCSPHIGHO2_02_FULL_60_44]OGL79753.1 MAG: hypothetical protein A3E39_01850 [Candidatus Uhrbacteria bacterium RIFCSPHIGHO2_12_FULL_60_25]
MNQITMKQYQNTAGGAVWSLFNDIAFADDVVLRSASVPYDGVDPGTIVSVVRREADGSTSTQDLFAPYDYETLSTLVRAYQSVKNTHVVTGDHQFSTFAYAKANLKTPAARAYRARVA